MEYDGRSNVVETSGLSVSTMAYLMTQAFLHICRNATVGAEGLKPPAYRGDCRQNKGSTI